MALSVVAARRQRNNLPCGRVTDDDPLRPRGDRDQAVAVRGADATRGHARFLFLLQVVDELRLHGPWVEALEARLAGRRLHVKQARRRQLAVAADESWVRDAGAPGISRGGGPGPRRRGAPPGC
jgi:hypothetical protein